jgi:hypothetical protein
VKTQYDLKSGEDMKTAIIAILALVTLLLPVTAQSAGSRENPVPMGTSVDMGNNNWEITVLSVFPNATNEMVYGDSLIGFKRDLDEEIFIAKIQAKYIGSGSSYFDNDNHIRAVGSASIGYAPISVSQGEGTISDYISNQEVFTGGVITGVLAWIIPPEHADHLVMYNPIIDVNMRTYMALFES